MTKTVRIENADNSSYKIKVLIQDKVYNHETKTLSDEWTTVEVCELNYPTALLEKYLTTTRRFIIEENGV